MGRSLIRLGSFERLHIEYNCLVCTAGYFASRSRSHVAAEVTEFFQTVEEMAGIPRTLLRPTDSTPFLRMEGDGKRHMRFMRWGLTPNWSKTAKFPYPTYNARCETIAEKASFREAFKSKRGLMPWLSYVEWREEGDRMIPYEFRLRSDDPIAFAAIWDQWGQGEEAFESCSMVTCEPNSLAAPYHDRMPVILESDDFDHWLDPEANPKDLLALLRPLPSELLVCELANPDDFRRKSKSKSTLTQQAVLSLFDDLE